MIGLRIFALQRAIVHNAVYTTMLSDNISYSHETRQFRGGQHD